MKTARARAPSTDAKRHRMFSSPLRVFRASTGLPLLIALSNDRYHAIEKISAPEPVMLQATQRYPSAGTVSEPGWKEPEV